MEKTELEFKNQHGRLSLVRGRFRGAEDGSRPGLPLSDIEQFRADWISEAEYLQQSPHTITGKRLALDKLLWWLRDSGCGECGPQELRRFFAYIGNGHLRPEGRWGNSRLKAPPSARTIQYYFNYLRSFLRWLEAEGYIEANPMSGLAVPKSRPEPIQPFSTENIVALLEAARRSNHPRRDEAILRFMLDTGVRASELCGLCLKDLDLRPANGEAMVLGKGNKVRAVMFSRKTARAMWQYLRESPARQPNTPVFLADRGPAGLGAPLTRSGLLQLFERLESAAGLTRVRCSPHTMRHTFAVRYLNRGGDLATLQRMLGHTSLHMTMKYLNLARADIANKHRQYSPGDEF